ncbi:translesion error-prone DNA polymerase V autoproteolytic subunit [Enterobacteriaceae bacterium 4M9]|nr:translesion error-prone DNA polymerase V autoproteolytic subunit [Enterobacteriaceae bacterium 4M9]
MTFSHLSSISKISTLPLFTERIPCGFPSPAQDYLEDLIDLNTLLVSHPSATFFLRASGDSMTDAGIDEGDLVVVDRSLKPEHGNLVIACIDGAFTLKELRIRPVLQLVAHNPNYPPIRLHDEEELEIFGVVTFTVKAHK